MPIFAALFWATLLGIRPTLKSGPARYIGNISYSLYLYHFLALSVATALIASPVMLKVCTFASAFVLATASIT